MLHTLPGGVLGGGGPAGLLGERVRGLLGLAAGLVGLLRQRCLLARNERRRADLLGLASAAAWAWDRASSIARSRAASVSAAACSAAASAS